MLKRIAAIAALLPVLAITALLVSFYVVLPKKRDASDVKAPTDDASIERGRYLVHHVTACIGCHSKVDEGKPGEPLVDGHIGEGRKFTDPDEYPDVPEIANFPGRLRGTNLTPDKTHGLGDWTDGEILRAMREGISRDGRVLFPMMPYTTYGKSLSDTDALAIIAYLRTLQPIAHDPGRTSIDFPVSMFIRGAPAPVETSPPPPPPATDLLARGAWLLSIASCHDCHDSTNERREPIPGKALAGGQPFPIPGKGTAYAANITSDAATGIGSYSDEDLLRVFNEGIGKSGRALYGMPWPYYQGMTDEDKRALVAALRKVPPVVNAVPPSTVTP